MHAEIRLRGKKKFYYLAHSFRDRGKVKKVRRYLGANLSEKKIQELRPGAEQSILKQIEIYRKIGDPQGCIRYSGAGGKEGHVIKPPYSQHTGMRRQSAARPLSSTTNASI